ncbi:MAG: sulfite exporter TauE/SafE family protein [Candidatus Nanopelagicales bacterium]|nr:sulfite exporter TauE/SafE family protein [Candidatus Nanopelagicales bacterium]
MDLTLALLAGMASGFLNVVAGGGTLIVFPTLVALGLSPLVANVTAAVGVFPGSLAGSWTYRKILSEQKKLAWLSVLLMPIFSIIGAALLLFLPEKNFETIVPFLIGSAGILIALQPLVYKLFPKNTKVLNLKLIIPGFILAGIYVGYFGAGTGVILLAIYGLAGLSNIQQANGLKNLGSGTGNAVAAVIFIFSGLVVWQLALSVAIGSIIGGALGGKFAQKLDASIFRIIILVIAIVASIYLFINNS